jgi:hypothetical protein
MRACKLLTDYYEREVLAGISALIYSFGCPKGEKTHAEQLAHQTAKLY